MTRDHLYLAFMLLIFLGMAYLIVMAAGPSMTRVPVPNYAATPIVRPGG